MSNAIAQAAVLVKQRAGVTQAAYDQLVSDLASSVERSPEDVLAIVEATGKTFEELEQDLLRVEARRVAERESAKIPPLEARLVELDAERARLRAELEHAQRQAGERDAKLAAELNQIQSQPAGLAEHRRKLSVGVFDSASERARRDKASQVLASVAPAAANLRTALATAERDLANAKTALAALEDAAPGRQVAGQQQHSPDQDDLARLASEKAAAQRNVELLRRELAPLDQQLAEADGELAALRGGHEA